MNRDFHYVCSDIVVIINSCPGIILATDDVIHIVCIDLEEKTHVLHVFKTENSPLQIYFLELLIQHIDAAIIKQ